MRRGSRSNGKGKRAPKGAGTLYKRDSTGKEHPADWQGAGAYWLSYVIPNKDGGKGRRIRQCLRDADGNAITDRKAAEAERKRTLVPYQTGNRVETLKAIQARILDAETARVLAVEDATPELKIADAWGAFIGHPNGPNCSERTLAQYEAEYKRFKAWIETRRPEAVAMRDVTKDYAVEYAADLDAAQVTASTFNQHRNLLALMWRTLGDVARVESNPWEKISRRKLGKLASRKRALTAPQYEALLAAAELDPDIRDLFVMLAWTGQRLVDVVMLPWGAVDFEKGIISLYPQKTAARTGAEVHPPLFPAARDMLNGRQDTGKPYKLNALIFPDLAAEYERDNGSTLTKRIGRIFEKTGLQTSETRPGVARAVVLYGAHSFRHFYVTQAAVAGMPAALIKRITGHTTDDMLEHYQHLGAEYSIEMARRINGKPTSALPHREPLPAWARELVESLTQENVETVKAAILKGGVA